MCAKLKAIKVELMRRRHEPIPKQGKWPGQVVGGFFGYHAVPTNSSALSAFPAPRQGPVAARALRRRSQKDRCTWAQIGRLAADFLPKPLIRHHGRGTALPPLTQGGSRMP
jgi:RNA-directed DNA polymerase